MVKMSQPMAYGDLQILDPESDLSFDDGSTSKFTMTSEHGSKASRRQDGVGHTISKSKDDAISPQIIFKAALSTQNKPDKTTLSPSSSSDASTKRFSVGKIFSRPKLTSFDAAVGHRNSFLKRKAEPWLKTRQGIKDKRIKYHSFSNDGYDDKDDLLISTQDVQKTVSSYGFEMETETPMDNNISILMKRGAYDNRPIHNNFFHGNDHDFSFHRDRMLGEPLLKPETTQQMSILNAQDCNPPADSEDDAIQWPALGSVMRDVPTPDQSLFPDPDTPCFRFNPFDQEDEQEQQSYQQKQRPTENLQFFSQNESHVRKKSFFANLSCLPKRRSQRKRGESRNSSAIIKHVNTTRGQFPQKKVLYDAVDGPKDHEISNKMSRSNSRQSLLDEETFEKESRQLDMLVNEFQRESPQLLRMSVASQLSAITEVDEDLTQRSSNLSAHSNIEQSGHLRYAALNPMLDDSSFRTEEPNFFAANEVKQKSDTVPMQVEHAQPASVLETKHNDADHPTQPQNDDVNKYLSKDKTFQFKGEEITLSSNSDEDSSGGVSDITEEFIHFPITSPLFKKAMDLFRDVASEEGEKETEQIEESRDDLDELKPFTQLHL